MHETKQQETKPKKLPKKQQQSRKNKTGRWPRSKVVPSRAWNTGEESKHKFTTWAKLNLNAGVGGVRGALDCMGGGSMNQLLFAMIFPALGQTIGGVLYIKFRTNIICTQCHWHADSDISSSSYHRHRYVGTNQIRDLSGFDVGRIRRVIASKVGWIRSLELISCFFFLRKLLSRSLCPASVYRRLSKISNVPSPWIHGWQSLADIFPTLFYADFLGLFIVTSSKWIILNLWSISLFSVFCFLLYSSIYLQMRDGPREYDVYQVHGLN